MGPLCKILGPGSPGLMYTVCRNGADASDRIHYPVNVSCRRDSLSVNDSGSHSHDSGTPFEASFVNFCVTKFRQNSGDISKKMSCAKFWPHVIRGPFPAGGPTHVRTVPNG